MTNGTPKSWEGPWTDEEGRQCLGVWANEGGMLLVLRAEENGAVSFHCATSNDLSVGVTIETFRLGRIVNFIDGSARPSGLRDLRKEALG